MNDTKLRQHSSNTFFYPPLINITIITTKMELTSSEDI